jgi:nucleoside-diphosphate-sugar epimerase
MKTLVAGATGAMGRQLLPRLAAAGHDVTGITRSDEKLDLIRSLGARGVAADVLDPDDVARAVAETEPDVIIHELTALSGDLSFRHFDRTFAMTNRLRTEATDHLLAAGRASGVQRFIAQSFAGWPFARTGGPVKTEDDPLDPHPVAAMRESFDAIRHLEDAVTGTDGIEGIVLRYGGFYGPGTGLSRGGDQLQLLRDRKFPVVGDGGGVWSFVHIEDAAEATAAAVTRGRPGIYNIVDDDPAPAREWLPAAASAVGAKPPRHLPRWLGRLAAGEAAVVMMTEIRGASNEKAKRELGWQPRHASWREGFAQVAA